MSSYSFTALLTIPTEAGYYFPTRHFEHILHKPLYALMISKLEEIEQVTKIVVNTDSDQIKRWYERSAKVKVINVYQAGLQEIEMELTSDRATAAMLEHAEGEHFVQLGPIFPFLKQKTIEDALEDYDKYVVNPENHPYDSVFTIMALNRRLYDSDIDFMPEDRPNTLIEDGILHVFSRTAFVAASNRKVGKRPYATIVENIENLAIDSEENYRLATLIEENQRYFPRGFGRR